MVYDSPKMNSPAPDRRSRARPAAGFSISVRGLRLASGLVLFTYVTLHFLNHALGNISVDAMERGLAVQKAIWRSVPGGLVLYAALLTHMSLGFCALYERRQFRIRPLEAAQLVLGLMIPFLLADHVVMTRVAFSLFGTRTGNYAQVLRVRTISAGRVAPGGAAPDRLDLRLHRRPFPPGAEADLPEDQEPSTARPPCCCRRSRCSGGRRASARYAAARPSPPQREMRLLPGASCRRRTAGSPPAGGRRKSSSPEPSPASWSPAASGAGASARSARSG